ncbi:hypothetical protein [Vibrio barjaei]|uniref:hypothetical protein n=1 Tax=Vibrio barjaei TaxID=1676683 RepID=UPI0007BB2F2C|nr:hypothetical protein [Vibrio barjaei]OIN25834.1 hypothetical protein AWH66_2016300 [Vibrio barjaei]
MLKENSSFIKTKPFIYTTIVFLLVFLIPTCSITMEYYEKMGVSFNFQKEGWETFLNWYDIPSKIFAAYLAVIGLVSLNHRSEQTKNQIDVSLQQVIAMREQMELSKAQDRFTNHFRHLEEFEKYVSRLSEGNRYRDIRVVHSKLFPNQINNGCFTIDKDILRSFAKSLQDVFDKTEESITREEEINILLASKYWVLNYNICSMTTLDNSLGSIDDMAKVLESHRNQEVWSLEYLLAAVASSLKAYINLTKFDASIDNKSLPLEKILDLIVERYESASAPISPLKIHLQSHVYKRQMDEYTSDSVFYQRVLSDFLEEY